MRSRRSKVAFGSRLIPGRALTQLSTRVSVRGSPGERGDHSLLLMIVRARVPWRMGPFRSRCSAASSRRSMRRSTNDSCHERRRLRSGGAQELSQGPRAEQDIAARACALSAVGAQLGVELRRGGGPQHHTRACARRSLGRGEAARIGSLCLSSDSPRERHAGFGRRG